MTVERLNNLCVLSVEHDLTLRYSWKKIIHLVLGKSEYRNY